jgi:hypothetical protein
MKKIMAIKADFSIPQYYRHKGFYFPPEVEAGGGLFSCQIHGPDVHPSALYNPETKTMKCLACDVRGDVIQIVQTVENLYSVKDAVDYILRTFNISMASALFADPPVKNLKEKNRRDLINRFELSLWKYIDSSGDMSILTAVSDAYLIKDNSILAKELTKLMERMYA